MASEWPPPPPDGYRFHNPAYDQPWYVTAALFLWLLSVLVGIPALLISVHGVETAVEIVRVVLQPDGWAEWPPYLAWVGGSLVFVVGAHEAIHALAGQWAGLQTSVEVQHRGLLSWSPEVLTYGAFQTRGESLRIVLAPLVILTPTSLLVLIMAHDLWVVASAAYLALGNSASAVGDLASAAVLWHLPTDELIYHDRESRRQYYTPVPTEESLTSEDRGETSKHADDSYDEHESHPNQ